MRTPYAGVKFTGGKCYEIVVMGRSVSPAIAEYRDALAFQAGWNALVDRLVIVRSSGKNPEMEDLSDVYCDAFAWNGSSLQVDVDFEE